MQVSVENTSTLGRRLTVSVANDILKKMMQERMDELSQNAKVSGFRPGKVPKQILQQRFGDQVRQDTVGKIIEMSLPEALQQNNLKPAGRPVVEQIENGLEQDFFYVVSFEIFPTVNLIDFSKIEIEKYQVTLTEKDVDNTLTKLQEQFAEWVVVDRHAKEGDRLIVDYTSTIQGKPYENNSAKDIQVEIGSHVFIEGFEQGLVGVSAGDIRELKLNFPKEWRIQTLAGKPVEFNVHIKAVTEKHIAELNEAFAKRLGAESSEKEVIQQKVRENLERQLSETIKTSLKEQVADALLKMNPIPIPKALVEREAEILHEEMHRRMGDKAETACHHPDLETQAQKRVALGLILNEVIKNEKLVADETLVKSKIASLAKMFGNADFIESMYDESDELLTQVRHTVLLDQAIDFVVNRCIQRDKVITLDEVFNRKSENREVLM